MKTLSGVKTLEKPLRRSVITIGNFDGLHLGHRKIISRIRELAESNGALSVVMTFDPHPRQVLSPDPTFKRVFLLSDLSKQLEVEKIDYLILEPFSRDLSQMEPEIFIQERVFKPLNPSHLVVGYDFSFGANRKGTLTVLEHICSKLNILLEVIPPYKIQDTIVSSTRIRQAVTEGDVSFARDLLGRNFYTEGIVERGEGRGRTIGFPTANLSLKSELIPRAGVYSGWLHFKGERKKAVANIGTNPTFHLNPNAPIKFEVFVLDFSADLYGENVHFEFYKRIRDEKRFSSVQELIAQIKKDVEIARDSLAN